MTAVATKTLTILNRVEIKYDNTIVYRVRSDTKTYSVTLHEDGTAGCYDEQNEECKGHHYSYSTGHECKHVQAAETAEFDREHSAWKQAHGLDKPLSREEYVREFDPDGAGMMLSGTKGIVNRGMMFEGMKGIADRLIDRLAAAEQIAEVA
jgi:hypothetical protein